MKLVDKMKILFIVLMFFVISALIIISNNGLAMYEQENVEKFSDLYLEYINQIYVNSQTITGEVVELDWLP